MEFTYQQKIINNQTTKKYIMSIKIRYEEIKQGKEIEYERGCKKIASFGKGDQGRPLRGNDIEREP